MGTIAKLKINENSIYKLAKNLRTLLDEKRLTESEIAQSINIPVMTVRRLVSGETIDPRISTLKLLADYFKISVDTLIEDNSCTSISMMKKTTPQFVPVLDWETVTAIKAITDLDLKNWKKWRPIALSEETTLNNHAFALESRPSMQPRFPTGTLFIIDPDETPNDGDITLIKMNADGNLSLRDLIIDVPRWQLQPIIPGSETLFYDKNHHSIMGIVVFTLLHCKREK